MLVLRLHVSIPLLYRYRINSKVNLHEDTKLFNVIISTSSKRSTFLTPDFFTSLNGFQCVINHRPRPGVKPAELRMTVKEKITNEYYSERGIDIKTMV